MVPAKYLYPPYEVCHHWGGDSGVTNAKPAHYETKWQSSEGWGWGFKSQPCLWVSIMSWLISTIVYIRSAKFDSVNAIFFQGSHSIEELLQKSDAIIPKEQRKTTPVALKATAGLRLLPSNSSKQLLEEVIILLLHVGLCS